MVIQLSRQYVSWLTLHFLAHSSDSASIYYIHSIHYSNQQMLVRNSVRNWFSTFRFQIWMQLPMVYNSLLLKQIIILRCAPSTRITATMWHKTFREKKRRNVLNRHILYIFLRHGHNVMLINYNNNGREHIMARWTL